MYERHLFMYKKDFFAMLLPLFHLREKNTTKINWDKNKNNLSFWILLKKLVALLHFLKRIFRRRWSPASMWSPCLVYDRVAKTLFAEIYDNQKSLKVPLCKSGLIMNKCNILSLIPDHLIMNPCTMSDSQNLQISTIIWTTTK